MAGQIVGSLDAQQFGMLADVQLDYYGKRAAAAVGEVGQVWDITDGQNKPAGTLKGHEGPVWKVAWAHPKFGSLLCTCGYDMKVIVWKEMPPASANWQMAYVDSSHQASVNDVQFCPCEHGLRLACASSDGTMSVLTYAESDQQWHRVSFPAHPGGVQALSWAPVQHQDGAPILSSMRIASGGCNNSISVWKCDGDAWVQEYPPLPPAHTDWVRAVAWRQDTSANVIASGSWDRSVVVWQQDVEGQPWRQGARIQVNGKVEGLAWSATGNILSVSCGEGETTLYKEGLDGSYEEVGKIEEQGYTEIARKAPPEPPQSSVPMMNGFLGAMPPMDAHDLAATQATPQKTTEDVALAAQQQQNVLEAFGM